MASLSLSDIKPRPEGYAYNLQPTQRGAVVPQSEDTQPATPTEEKPPGASTDYTGPGGSGSHPAAMLETLPEELLKNPLIFSVAKGNPAAISAPDKSKDPAVLAVVKHAQPLVAAGFGIYQSIDKKLDVLFNTQIIHPGDLIEADQAGKLLEIAPPFDTIEAGAPATPAEATPSGGAGAAPIVQTSQPAGSVQRKLASLRGRNLQPGSPTSGPAPGAGNILNSILRPAV